MRITGNRLIEQASAATSRAQSAYGKAASTVSSGLKVASPSDDPAAWLAAHRAKLHQSIVDGASAALQSGRDRVAQTDAALQSISSIVGSVRELAVQGANSTYGADARANLGTEVAGLYQAALAAANTQAPDGEYLLAGSRSLGIPFDATGAYQGDATARPVLDSESGWSSHLTSIAGSDLTAAGSVPNSVDVIPLLDKVAKALSANDTTTLNSALGDLDKAVKQLGGIRTRAGGMMSSIDSVTQAHTILSQTLATTASNLVEADTVQAASQLAQANQALSISQTVASNVIQAVGKLAQ